MRELPPEFANEIAKRGPISARTFIVVVAKNRETNVPERLCLWTGDDHQEFNVEGVNETFYGASGVLSIDDIKNEIGTNIRKLVITLANLTPEVAILIRGFNVKLAEVRIYTALFSPESGLQVTPFLRRFKGWVDKAPITTARKGSGSTAKFECVNHSRNLSRTVPSRRSNENQRLRNSGDAFFNYVTVTGNIQTNWGTKTAGENRQNIRTVLEGFSNR